MSSNIKNGKKVASSATKAQLDVPVRMSATEESGEVLVPVCKQMFFCGSQCTCGAKILPCTNKPGRPDSVLLKEMGLEAVVEDCFTASDDDSDVSNCHKVS